MIRGTLRKGIQAAGLDPAALNGHQLQVVLEKVMPGALQKQGVADSEEVCRRVAELAQDFSAADSVPESATDIFKRLTSS